MHGHLWDAGDGTHRSEFTAKVWSAAPCLSQRGFKKIFETLESLKNLLTS